MVFTKLGQLNASIFCKITPAHSNTDPGKPTIIIVSAQAEKTNRESKQKYRHYSNKDIRKGKYVHPFQEVILDCSVNNCLTMNKNDLENLYGLLEKQ